MIRTFHPIGQGAFYTERHTMSDSKEFTIVYDCGSGTQAKISKPMSKKIVSAFPNNHVIDVLFISHFHSDHINGIEALKEHCDIKKVIIPLIDEETKILINVDNVISRNLLSKIDFQTELLDNPSNLFGNDRVITVKELLPTEGRNDTINLENNININELSDIKEIDSGTALKLLKNDNNEWLFIPLNYKHNLRALLFEKALTKRGLSFKDIDTLDKIIAKRKKIKEAYKEINADLNKHSLILFSGIKPINKGADYIKHVMHSQIYHCCLFSDLYCPCLRNSPCGCLYLGDIDLNQENIVSDIQNRLNLVFQNIGTIQMPHHGSIDSFNSNILEASMQCAIFSYGTNNPFGHPSDRVIEYAVEKGLIPLFVTEQKETIVIQMK